MRGKGNLFVTHYEIARITPAYAGKSRSSQRKKSGSRDHPRLCGEKLQGFSTSFLLLGSPPPMRGKDEYGASLDRTQGITPAYAGKRSADALYGNGR